MLFSNVPQFSSEIPASRAAGIKLAEVMMLGSGLQPGGDRGELAGRNLRTLHAAAGCGRESCLAHIWACRICSGRERYLPRAPPY